MRKKYLCILIISIILIVEIGGNEQSYLGIFSNTKYAEEPIFAYKANVIPTINGKITPSEWNDTKIYEYIRKSGNRTYYIECGVKYSDEWLYIFYSIKSDNSLMGGLNIDTQPINNRSLTVYHTIVLLMGGGNAYLGEYYIAPNYTGRDVVKIDPTHPLPNIYSGFYTNHNSHNEIMYEIKLHRSYLNLSYRYAPFNIEFVDYPFASLTGVLISIGPPCTASPGIVLLPISYSPNNEAHREICSMDTLLYITSFMFGFAVGGVCWYVIFRKYKGIKK